MTAPHAPEPGASADPELGRALRSALDTCRRDITRFHAAPAPAREKASVHGGREVVTELDLTLQERLTAELSRTFPGVPVIAEEGLAAIPQLPDECLLVDPLDGTAPFLVGSSDYAIAVCLVRDGIPAEGVIDLPAHDLRISAAPGLLHVTGDVTQLPHHGSHTVLTSPSRTAAVQDRLSGTGWSVRPVTTASVKIAFVALGRAPAAVYLPRPGRGAAPWDYPAAALAVAAAGGSVHDTAGSDLARTRPARLDGWLALHRPPEADLSALLRSPAATHL
ncbi:inositol monophosphatase family protein [Streptomyces sp. SUK 48]|uniref:inositol monophosphatase family protein n=1 Tax=Streptomyces sp. SUK 48 TaxID=2582831 RepID=UPI00189174EF|nr:inositol monophosphatase family protein [Streptomyces sp. SUK 48]